MAPTSVDMLRGLGPILSQLLGEIRNIIYSYLLSTGHLQFLRASKALFAEGTGLMAENGIYRMGFGFSNRINYSLPSQRIVDTIRNLDVHVDLSYFKRHEWCVPGFPRFWILEVFGKPLFPRGQCTIFLQVDCSTPIQLVAAICQPLRLLSDFETVSVRAEIVWLEPNAWSFLFPESLMAQAAAEWLKEREATPVPWSLFKCQFFHDLLRLSWNLGEGCLKEQDERGFRLVFHPRKALEEYGEVQQLIN